METREARPKAEMAASLGRWQALAHWLGCATNLWVMRSPPLEKGDKGGFIIENCLLLQKSPLTPLCQRGVIHSLPTNLSHTPLALPI